MKESSYMRLNAAMESVKYLSGSGRTIHIYILEIVPKRIGYYGEVKHNFSFPNGCLSGGYDTNP